MENIKMRWLATGDNLVLWQAEDHPDAKPGRPVWTDKDGTNWGDAVKWPVPYGFIRLDDPDISLFSPVLSDYWKLKMFFGLHYTLPTFDLTLDNGKIKLPGMPKYILKNYKTLSGADRLMVIFDERIIIPSGERSDRFVIWIRPALKLDPAGEEHEWIPFF